LQKSSDINLFVVAWIPELERKLVKLTEEIRRTEDWLRGWNGTLDSDELYMSHIFFVKKLEERLLIEEKSLLQRQLDELKALLGM
jgi:hypothetical protein